MNEVTTRDAARAVSAPEARNPLGMFDPSMLEGALKAADMLAKSDLVPKDFQGKPGNCLIAIQWGAELGLPPLQAMQNIAVINGRPSIWGDALLALVRGSGALVSINEWIEGDDGDKPNWIAHCEVVRRGADEPVRRSFSWDDAKTANLADKQGPWRQYPKRMLQMRARGFALRDVFTDVLKGLYVAEEAQDMPRDEPRDITPESEKSANQSESVRKKIAGKKGGTRVKADAEDAQDETGPTLDSVIAEMRDAQNAETLEKVAAQVKGLSNGDKDKAREVYADRLREIRAHEATALSNRLTDALMSDNHLETYTTRHKDALERLQKIDPAAAKSLLDELALQMEQAGDVTDED